MAIKVRYTADTDDLEKGSKRAEGAIGSVAKIASGFVVAQGLMALPGIMSSIVGEASDINESMSKVATVFGDDSAESMERWAVAMAKMGTSKADALSAVGTFGNFFATIGVNKDEAAGMSQSLVQLASDFGSFHNASPVEVMDAMGAALRGEAEPMARFGILMNDATLKAQALKMGLIATDKEALSPQTKALAANALMFEQAGAAMGDFDRTSDGLANRQRILGAEFSNVKAELGEALLPAALAVATALMDLVPVASAVGGAIGDGIAYATPYVLEFVGYAAGLAQTFGETVLPPLMEFARAAGPEVLGAAVALWQTQLVPAFEAGRAVFEAIAPHVVTVATAAADLGAAVADKLQGPLTSVLGFLASHQDEIKIFGAAMLIAVPIVYALAAAQTVQATAATAAGVATGVAMLPVLAIAAAVGALAVGVYLLVTRWDELTAKYPVVQAATDNIKAVFDAFVAWIADPFVPAVGAIATGVGDAVMAAVGFVTDNWDGIRAIIQPAVEVLATIVETNVMIWATVIETAIGIAQGVITTVMGLITGDWGMAWDGIKQILTAAWDGIKEAVSLAVGGVQEIAATIGPLVLSAIGNAGELLRQVGRDIVQGLINGVGDMGGALHGAISGMASDAIGWAKSGFGVFSPSRVFRDIGVELPAGLVQGIESGSQASYVAMAEWINELADEARSAWWIANADFAQELANAGLFVHEDGSVGGGTTTGGNAGVSTGFDGWLSNNGVDRGNDMTNKPTPGPTGGPGTQGSGWAYVSNGAGGYKLMPFPLSDGQVYWYFDSAGNWKSGVMVSEGGTPSSSTPTGSTGPAGTAGSGLAGGAGFGSASSPGGGFGAGAYTPPVVSGPQWWQTIAADFSAAVAGAVEEGVTAATPTPFVNGLPQSPTNPNGTPGAGIPEGAGTPGKSDPDEMARIAQATLSELHQNSELLADIRERMDREVEDRSKMLLLLARIADAVAVRPSITVNGATGLDLETLASKLVGYIEDMLESRSTGRMTPA